MRRRSRTTNGSRTTAAIKSADGMAAGMQRKSRADGVWGVWDLLSEVRTHRDKSECDARWCSGADIVSGEMGLIAEMFANQRDVG